MIAETLELLAATPTEASVIFRVIDDLLGHLDHENSDVHGLRGFDE